MIPILRNSTKALMTLKGVKSVDLHSMPGHAVVVHDDSVSPKTLVEVIKGVKGDGWFCTAQIM
ncbi:MAG: heavy metal-associated domain-containing protein [Nitrospiria bacterium]